jgi:hypothetical protein
LIPSERGDAALGHLRDVTLEVEGLDRGEAHPAEERDRVPLEPVAIVVPRGLADAARGAARVVGDPLVRVDRKADGRELSVLAAAYVSGQRRPGITTRLEMKETPLSGALAAWPREESNLRTRIRSPLLFR